MGTIADIEIRPGACLSPKERAAARDSFVRAFERQFADWTEIAKVCIEVERDRDWELLGFHSWHAWLMAAAPRSRSYIYLVTNRYKELIPDIPELELADMPLGTAGIMARRLSSAVRRDPKVRAAAKQKPGKFIQAVREMHPEQHLEDVDERILKFTVSQAEKFDEAFEIYQREDESASPTDFVEGLIADYLEENQ